MHCDISLSILSERVASPTETVQLVCNQQCTGNPVWYKSRSATGSVDQAVPINTTLPQYTGTTPRLLHINGINGSDTGVYGCACEGSQTIETQDKTCVFVFGKQVAIMQPL